MSPLHQEPVEVTVARIEEIVLRMETRLFGNGQPGELEKLSGRVAKVEETKHKYQGAIGVISVLLMITGGTLLAHILKH